MIIYICMVMPVWRSGGRWMLLIATRCWWGLTKRLSRITMVTTNHRQHSVLYCHRWNKGNTILIRQIIGYITILCWGYFEYHKTHFKLKEISSRNAIYLCSSNITWFKANKITKLHSDQNMKHLSQYTCNMYLFSVSNVWLNMICKIKYGEIQANIKKLRADKLHTW